MPLRRQRALARSRAWLPYPLSSLKPSTTPLLSHLTSSTRQKEKKLHRYILLYISYFPISNQNLAYQPCISYATPVLCVWFHWYYASKCSPCFSLKTPAVWHVSCVVCVLLSKLEGLRKKKMMSVSQCLALVL